MTFKFIEMITNDKYKAGTDVDQDSDAGRYQKESLTGIFHTFVFLQIFNYINCRKVGRQEFNVFEEFGHNLYFLGILFGTAGF
jgi:hypothetical protein